jgi:hypothetical protein
MLSIKTTTLSLLAEVIITTKSLAKIQSTMTEGKHPPDVAHMYFTLRWVTACTALSTRWRDEVHQLPEIGHLYIMKLVQCNMVGRTYTSHTDMIGYNAYYDILFIFTLS